MRRDLNGFAMLVAALTIVALVIALVVDHEVELRREQMRAQGLALTNALSRVPLDRLVPEGRHLGALSLVRSGQSGTRFAYAIVLDSNDRILDRVLSADIEPPALSFGDEPSTWTAERSLEIGGKGRRVRDFTAPILEDGRRIAQVRIGFVEPTYAVVLDSLSFHASVALIVFMLMPIGQLWLRREIRPLRDVAGSLPQGPREAATATIDPEAPASASIEAIARRFERFRDEMEERSEAIARERIALLASTKVASHERNRIQILLKAIPDAVLALDETGRVTLANARAEALLRRHDADGTAASADVESGALIGLPATSWCPAPELAQLVGRYSGANGRLLRSESVEFSSRDGGERRFRASIHPLDTGQGMSVVIREITDEWIARKTQAEFLAHMAHELKAPLNVMSIYSEMLLGPEGADETQRVDACNVIRDEIDRLNSLINNIFSIGRIESGSVSLDRQRVRVRALLADVFETIERSDGDDSLEFVLDLPEEMPAIYADKSLLSIAVKNLLTNAVKYNRPEGKVSLSAETPDDGLLIRVSDTGAGIAEDELDQVFEKFFRSEDESIRKVAGHGLGLALVKEIIALHGGEIRVASVQGQGSEFSLFFDRHSAIFRGDN